MFALKFKAILFILMVGASLLPAALHGQSKAELEKLKADRKKEELKNLYYQGRNWLEKKNPAQAVYFFKKALVIDSRFYPALRDMGAAWLLAEKPEKAISLLKKSLKIQKNDTSSLLMIGLCFAKLQKTGKALAYIDSYIALKPQNDTGYINRAYVFDKMGDHQKALNDYQYAYKLNGKSATALLGQATQLSKLNKDDEAAPLFFKVLEKNPNHKSALFNAAQSLYTMGDYGRVLSLTDRLISLDQVNAEAWHLKGLALFELRQRSDACACFKNAARMGDKESAELYKEVCVRKP